MITKSQLIYHLFKLFKPNIDCDKMTKTTLMVDKYKAYCYFNMQKLPYKRKILYVCNVAMATKINL